MDWNIDTRHYRSRQWFAVHSTVGAAVRGLPGGTESGESCKGIQGTVKNQTCVVGWAFSLSETVGVPTQPIPKDGAEYYLV